MVVVFKRRRLIVWGFLVSAAAIAGGVAATREMELARVKRTARAAVEGRRFAEAEAPLAHWLEARPRDGEAHALKARVELARDRPQETMDEVRQALALGYPEAPLQRLRAIILARGGRYAEAEPILRQTLAASDAPDPEAAEALVKCTLETFRLGATLQALDRWQRDAPADPAPWLWRADVDERSGATLDRRIADYREALARGPKLPKARLGLADALRQSGQVEEAASAYAAYIALRPDDPEGHAGAGNVAVSRGEEAGALAHFARALELKPDHVPSLLGRAGILLRKGDPAGALPLLDRAIQADPFDFEARFRRGRAYAALGRTDDARAEEDAAGRLRRDAEELKSIRDGLVRAPDDRRLQAEAARWLIDHGHDAEGLAWARRVLDARPGHPETNRLLADYYERRGDRGRANFHRLQSAGQGGQKP